MTRRTGDVRRWDIKGKVLGCPVWQLLGGKVRDKIKLYGHVAGPEWGPPSYDEAGFDPSEDEPTPYPEDWTPTLSGAGIYVGKPISESPFAALKIGPCPTLAPPPTAQWGLRASVAGLAGITNGAFISEPPRFIDNAIKTFSTLREVAGPDIELAVDFHGRAHQNHTLRTTIAGCSCC